MLNVNNSRNLKLKKNNYKLLEFLKKINLSHSYKNNYWDDYDEKVLDFGRLPDERRQYFIGESILYTSN